MTTPTLVGNLHVSVTGGKEVFSFAYAPEGLNPQPIKRLNMYPIFHNLPNLI